MPRVRPRGLQLVATPFKNPIKGLKKKGKLPRCSGAELFGYRHRRGVASIHHVAELHLNLQRCHVPNSPRCNAAE